MESISIRCMIDMACDLGRDWKKFGHMTGLSKHVEQIEQDYRRNVFEQAYRILQAWKETKGFKATYQALNEAFRTLKRVDLAEKYCEGGNQGLPKTEILEGTIRPGIVQDEVTTCISNELGAKWVWVGRLLGLEDSILDGIKEDNDKVFECTQQMLLSWKQKSTSHATYEKLAQALIHPAVGKRSIAEQYCIEQRESENGVQQIQKKMEQLQVQMPKERGGAGSFVRDGDMRKMDNCPAGSTKPPPVPDDCIKKKFITDLPYKVWGALVVKLDPPRELSLRGDFKDLADEMGCSTDQILYFKSVKNPTETVLTSCSSRSIEDLCNKLDLIGREDARLVIDKWVASKECKCTMCEKQKLDLPSS